MDDRTMPEAISPEVKKLHTYLTDRGIPLDPTLLDLCGVEFVTSSRISEILGYQVPHGLGIAFHYPGTDYTTVRVVSSADPKIKGSRCPKGRPVEGYLCPLTDWDTVSGTLVICESPLKAITWGMYGYSAMAAGGVDTVYMSRRDRWCEGFPHAAIESGAITQVKIAWDSDIESNHNVARALRVLCRALRERHPDVEVLVHELTPPPEDWPKDSWGVDDAHAHYGAEWFKEWAESDVCRDPVADEVQEHYDALDEKYVLCLQSANVINIKTDARYSATNFKAVIESHRKIVGARNRMLSVAAMWLDRIDKPTVEGRRYLPGKPTITRTQEGMVYNSWKESPVQPIKGDVTPWLDLINDAVKDQEIKQLMLQCMAYQVQNRSIRLEKLLYFVGAAKGTGKSTQARIMQKILGERNTGWVTKTDIEGSFNAIWAAKELVVMDDIGKLRVDTWAKLKTHITSNTVAINEKNMPAWEQKNYMTMYITSNHSNIVAADTEDRRILMIHFEPDVVHRDAGDDYWKDFYHWLEEGGGYQAIAHYLGTMDLEDFDPHFYPPVSDIKEAAMEARQSEEVSFLVEFKNNPDMYLHPDRVIVTGHELYFMMTQEQPGPHNAKERRKLSTDAKTALMFKRVKFDTTYQFNVNAQLCTTLFVVPGRSLPRFEDIEHKRRWCRKQLELQKST